MELQRWMFALILTGALFACTKEAKQEQQVAAKTAVASEAKAPDFARPMLLHDFVDLSSLVTYAGGQSRIKIRQETGSEGQALVIEANLHDLVAVEYGEVAGLADLLHQAPEDGVALGAIRGILQRRQGQR